MSKYIVHCVIKNIVEVNAKNTKAAIEQARHSLSEHDDIDLDDVCVMYVSEEMNKEKFIELEVRPHDGKTGLYNVVLYNFNDETYTKDWLIYDGNAWDYAEYSGNCYVCFISDKRGSHE